MLFIINHVFMWKLGKGRATERGGDPSASETARLVRLHMGLGAKCNQFFENLGPPPLPVRGRGPSANSVRFKGLETSLIFDYFNIVNLLF